jgi:quercetin dioxygenase-like cupin family protein
VSSPVIQPAHHHHDEVAQRNAAIPILERVYEKVISQSPSGILSSRQSAVQEATQKDLVNVISPEFDGVTRWYIPIAPHVPTAKEGTHRYYAYYALFQPNAEIPNHAHSFTIGELIVVISGSLFFLGEEHTVGDWLWVPPGKEYSLRAGTKGAYALYTWPATESTVEDVKNPPNPKLQNVGLALIQAVDTYLDTNVNHGNTTARDALVCSAFDKLADPLPHKWPGVTRWFFPYGYRAPDIEAPEYGGRYLAYIAHIDPNVKITDHTHPIERLADKRVVLSGTIYAEGKELTAGDFFWVPANTKYSFTTGKTGAVTLLISCYA